jgi:hypothetical protein
MPRRGFDPEIIELFPGSELRGQPAWLFPAACPGFGRLRRISILRKHLRVRASCVAYLLSAIRRCPLAKLAQSLLKPCFLGWYPVDQFRGN